MESAIVGALAAAIGVPIAMAALARFFPARAPSAGDRPLEDLRKEFRSWYLLNTAMVILLAPPVGYLWWRAFLALGSATAARLPDAHFVLVPMAVAWALPAIFAGIVSCGPILEAFNKLLLGERYQEFVRFQDAAFRMNTEALNRPFYIGGAVLVAIGVLALQDWYAYVTESDFVHNPLLGFSEHRYSLSDLREIRTAPALIAPNGKKVQRREYVFRFANGETWATNWDPSDASEDSIARMVHFVSSQAEVRVTEVDYLTKDELW